MREEKGGQARPCWILVFIPRTIGSLRGVKQQGDRVRFVFSKQSLPSCGGVNSGRRWKQVEAVWFLGEGAMGSGLDGVVVVVGMQERN